MTTEYSAGDARRDPELSTPPERSYEVTEATDSDPARRELRADVGKYVSLAEFPATRQSLLDSAAAHGAPEFVISALRGLPSDAALETARDLWIALDLEATERF